MPPSCIRHTDLPHTSALFADYLYHFERVARFYDWAPHRAESYRDAAARIDYPASRRDELVAALRAQNGDHPALEALGRAGTLAVVTGQQVGLFSGPCYTIYKALTAAAVARRLTASGMPAVPVFWLATEDHDLDEVNHCYVFDSTNRPVRLEITGTNPQRRPVGEIAIECAPAAELRAALRDLPFAEDAIAAVEQAYAPGETFGSAFAKLLRAVLPNEGLLLLDPMHPASRRLAAPLIRRAVEAAPELTAGVLERNRELTAAGYHAQVHVDEQTSFVFLLEGGARLPLHRRDTDYELDGRRIETRELADRAAELSPNALLRPVAQDYMLPTVAYIGGPAELAYLAQSQVLYRTLLGRMPVAAPRQSATLLDARAAKLFDRYGLTLPDFFHGEQELRERIAKRLVPPVIGESIAHAKAQAAAVFDDLAATLSGFDRTLADAFAKSRRKMEYQLAKTERKAARAALHRNERAAAEASYLDGLVYPDKHLQERYYSIVPFLARHGPDVTARLAEDTKLDCLDHRVIAV